MMEGGSILLAGGTVVDPSQGLHGRRDVLIEGGLIAAVSEAVSRERAARVIDASGLLVLPGFVDLHCHLREPGGGASETIETGTAAAAAGGFTTVFCMPNTSPVCDSAVVVKYVLGQAAERGRVRVVPVGAVTREQKGEQLSDLGALKGAGAGAFSDDGRPVANAMVMRRALTYARMLDMPVFDHAEDMSLTADGVMHEGNVSLRLGLKGIPRASEATIVARDCALAHETGGRLHICHVSNRDSVAAIRHWKDRGAPVTAEVTPHHLVLTDEAVSPRGLAAEYRTSAKMKPPLCSEDDRRTLIEALEDGTIDCIATDHAPHSPASKDTLFQEAPFGIIGFETAFAVLHRAFVETGRWKVDFLVERLAWAPARVLGAEWGTLRVGSAADVAVVRVGVDFLFDESRVFSRSRNSPWLGERFGARVALTVVDGRVVYEDGSMGGGGG